MKLVTLMTLAFLATVGAHAASSGNLLIQGTVNLVNDISITPTANATTLNILGGESGKLVATVDESSNDLNGYKIQMSSANAGKLVHTTDNAKLTSYTASYAGGPATSLSTSAQTVKNVSSLSGLTTTTSNVTVNVTALPTAVAGTYQDTITVSIVAN